MKILVMSDSHSGLSFMRACIRKIKPDAMIHLGDYYEDAQAMTEEFPKIPMHRVPGNCDKYRMLTREPEIVVRKIGGVMMYLTHGHRHMVKSGTYQLVHDAREAKAAIALYGHTHEADCRQEQDGLWVLNPGTCGFYGGSVGYIETENDEIKICRLLREADLEAFV